MENYIVKIIFSSISYNLPTENYLKKIDDQYEFTYNWGILTENMIADEFHLDVILPTFSFNHNVELPSTEDTEVNEGSYHGILDYIPSTKI